MTISGANVCSEFVLSFVCDGDEIVGYADLQDGGYIDHFFVSGHHPRRGIGSMLMDRIHEVAGARGLTQLTSDVSRTAEPLFRRYGFVVVERKEPVVRGVVVPNASMRKDLAGHSHCCDRERSGQSRR